MEKNTPVQLEERAYHIWEREGRPHGRALDHWLQAQTEVGADAPDAKPKRRTRKAASSKAKTTNGTAKSARAKTGNGTAKTARTKTADGNAKTARAKTAGGNAKTARAKTAGSKSEPAKAKPKKVAKSDSPTRKTGTGRKRTTTQT